MSKVLRDHFHPAECILVWLIVATFKNSLIILALRYITLGTIYSGRSKSNFKDHYGDAATEQCLG